MSRRLQAGPQATGGGAGAWGGVKPLVTGCGFRVLRKPPTAVAIPASRAKYQPKLMLVKELWYSTQ